MSAAISIAAVAPVDARQPLHELLSVFFFSQRFSAGFFFLQKRFRKFCSSFAAVVERANGLLQKESRREESSSGWWQRRCSHPCVQMRFQRLYRRGAAATDVPGVQRNCRLPDGDCAFLLLLFFLRNTTLLPSLSLLLQQRCHHSGQGVSHPSFFLQGNSSSLHSALLAELFLGFGFQVRSSSKTPVTLPSISEERVKLLQMSQLLLLMIIRSISSSRGTSVMRWSSTSSTSGCHVLWPAAGDTMQMGGVFMEWCLIATLVF